MVIEFGQSIDCDSCYPSTGPDGSCECEFCPAGMALAAEPFESEIPEQIVDEVHEFMNRYNWMGV